MPYFLYVNEDKYEDGLEHTYKKDHPSSNFELYV